MKMLLVLLFVHMVFGDSCLNSFSMNTSTLFCKINFIPFGGSCASSKFNYCTISYCSSSSSISNCSNFNSFNEFTFSNCMKFCCGSSLSADNPYESVIDCASNSKKDKNETYASVDIGRVMMIVMSIFGATAILIGIAFCVYRKAGNFGRIRAIEDGDNNPEAPNLNIKKLSSEQLSVHNLMDREWKDVSINLNQHPNCSICLGDRPNLKVRCGHYFHPNCLRSWFKKKYQCEVCRGSRLSVFQLACSGCLCKSTELTLEQLIKFKRVFNKFLCSQCSSS